MRPIYLVSLWIFVLFFPAPSSSLDAYTVIFPNITSTPSPQQVYITKQTSSSVSVTLEIPGYQGDVHSECVLATSDHCLLEYDLSGDEELARALYGSGLRVYTEDGDTISVVTIRVSGHVMAYTALVRDDRDKEFVLGPFDPDVTPSSSEPIGFIATGPRDTDLEIYEQVNSTFDDYPLFDDTLSNTSVGVFEDFTVGTMLLRTDNPVSVYIGQLHSDPDLSDWSDILQVPGYIRTQGGDTFVFGPLQGVLTIIMVFTEKQTLVAPPNIIIRTSDIFSGNVKGSGCQCQNSGSPSSDCELGCDVIHVGDYVMISDVNGDEAYELTSDLGVIVYVKQDGFLALQAPIGQSSSNSVRVIVPQILPSAEGISKNYINVAITSGSEGGLSMDGVSYPILDSLGVVSIKRVYNFDVVTLEVAQGLHNISQNQPGNQMTIFVHGYAIGIQSNEYLSYGFVGQYRRNPSNEAIEKPNAGKGFSKIEKVLLALTVIFGVLMAGGVIVIVLIFTRPEWFGRQKKQTRTKELPYPADIDRGQNNYVPNNHPPEQHHPVVERQNEAFNDDELQDDNNHAQEQHHPRPVRQNGAFNDDELRDYANIPPPRQRQDGGQQNNAPAHGDQQGHGAAANLEEVYASVGSDQSDDENEEYVKMNDARGNGQEPYAELQNNQDAR